MLSAIEGCPIYEGNQLEWERVVRHHLSEYSKEALMEFAVRARVEVEHLNMHLTHAYRMHSDNIAGLDVLRSLARRNPDSLDIQNEIAKLEVEHGSENADFIRVLAHAASKKYSKNLNDEGRRQGAMVIKQRSEEHRNHLRTAVEDIFNNKLTFDWKDREIARWLMEKGFHRYEGIEIGERQMINNIKKVRKAYKLRANSPAG